jgi:CHAD domain-containing protein
VCACLFDEEASRAEVAPTVVRLLRDQLAAARDHAHRKLAKALAEFDAIRLREDLDVIMTRGGASSDEAASRLKTSRGKHVRPVLQELRARRSVFAPMALHAIRRRCRWLRYAAELDRALFGGAAAGVKRFRELQDLLGQLHDALLLADWIAREATSWEVHGKPARAAAARVVSAHFQDRAQNLHLRFLSARTADWLEGYLSRNTALFKPAAPREHSRTTVMAQYMQHPTIKWPPRST